MNDKTYSKSSPSPLIYADILYRLTLPNDFIYLNDFHLLCTVHKLTSFIGTDRQQSPDVDDAIQHKPCLALLTARLVIHMYRCSVTIQARVTYAHGCSESLYRFRCNESGHDNYIRKYGVHSMQCYRKEPMNFFLHPLKICQNCYRKQIGLQSGYIYIHVQRVR